MQLMERPHSIEGAEPSSSAPQGRHGCGSGNRLCKARVGQQGPLLPAWPGRGVKCEATTLRIGCYFCGCSHRGALWGATQTDKNRQGARRHGQRLAKRTAEWTWASTAACTRKLEDQRRASG